MLDKIDYPEMNEGECEATKVGEWFGIDHTALLCDVVVCWEETILSNH